MNNSWRDRSLGSAFQHHIFYTMIRLGGRYGAYALLVLVVAWYVLFRPSVRKRCRFFLQRRFPGRGAVLQLLDCYRLCLAFGKVLVDRAVLGILGPRKMKVSLEGREELSALLAEGHGLILVTAHVGSWQLGMANLCALGTPISLLIHREEGDMDRPFYGQGKQSPPYRIINPLGFLGGTLEMLQVLKNGEVLCIMGDRVMGGEGSHIAVDFLGSAVSVPFSPYKLASATEAPIAVIFPHISGGKSCAMYVARVIRVPENLGRSPAAFQPYAKEFAQALEEFVQAHPFQFFNFFDLWTELPVKPDPSM